MSYHRRYISGDHEAVWSELRGLGPVPDHLAEDVAAVAGETMRRVTRHIVRLVEALQALGHQPPADEAPPIYLPASEADRADLMRLTAEIGGLPAALAACMSEVGQVWLPGDCPAVGLYYDKPPPGQPTGMPPGPAYPDPLVLAGVSYLRSEWDEYRDCAEDEPDDEDYPFVFSFAPDELHKANISGGAHDIELFDLSADPVLDGIAGRPGITLVEYLRTSIAWGGLPGWSFAPDQAPAALDALRARPNF